MNDQLTKELRAFEEDHIWVNEHLESLLSQYTEQWIAVKGGQVIATNPEFMSLLKKLPDPAHTYIQFITREPLEMIL